MFVIVTRISYSSPDLITDGWANTMENSGSRTITIPFAEPETVTSPDGRPDNVPLKSTFNTCEPFFNPSAINSDIPLNVASITVMSSAVPIFPSGPGHFTGTGVPVIWGGLVSASLKPSGRVNVAVISFKDKLLPSGALFVIMNMTLKY